MDLMTMIGWVYQMAQAIGIGLILVIVALIFKHQREHAPTGMSGYIGRLHARGQRFSSKQEATRHSSSSGSFSSWVLKLNRSLNRSSSSDPPATPPGLDSQQGVQPEVYPVDLSAEDEARNERNLQKHANGSCEPCLFFESAGGCAKGQQCEYCHFPHQTPETTNSQRPGKRDRQRIKASIEKILEEAKGEDLQHELQWEARCNAFTRKTILNYLNERAVG
eukprot:s2944_g2.t1